jgi:hypothetical protein
LMVYTSESARHKGTAANPSIAHPGAPAGEAFPGRDGAPRDLGRPRPP